ncbi:non-reducing end alpha-L-arabinofuranosidase family hydrolase [Saccharomonospora saliphila]|uniref:non-reducing end alpha-L-arabinofuranosidase family hydrolase n=1 Tax=Saccharomonospora saliphila TaxID=369829 RepID=UPI00039A3D18|nr:non-reducing end alpha-L-arabinofuranosidase family hydrolase [Saccharomonospora saliphila]
MGLSRRLRAAGVSVLAFGLLSSTFVAEAGADDATSAFEAGQAHATFDWTSTPPVITPDRVDGRDLISAKDPTVVRTGDTWHVFHTMFEAGTGWTLAYRNFTDWAQADNATQHMLDQGPIGPGYRAAPQVFYFAPHDLWYLVYQTGGGGSYSTTRTLSDPSSWSPPQNFYSSMPQIIRDNIGDGHWVDFWTICDEARCHLFSSDDNGHLYRSETTVENFPHGFDDSTVIALEDSRYRLFEAANIYRIGDTGQYLLLHEAIGGDGRRWFRSWTSSDIAGPWTALADEEHDPFARATNVTFPGGRWTEDISHGEMIRSENDQSLTIDPCAHNQFLYQGVDPGAGGDYGLLPYRVGLLFQAGPDPLDQFC